MNPNFLVWLQEIASDIMAFTTIGTALIWIGKKIIVSPMEKRRVEREEIKMRERNEFEQKLLKEVDKNHIPLKEAIDRLNQLLDESQRDRSALHKIADVNTQKLDEHETRIHDLDDRLIVVETHNNITKYREVYKGDN